MKIEAKRRSGLWRTLLTNLTLALLLTAYCFLPTETIAQANQPASGNALSFDGVDDYVDCGDINSGTFDGINDHLTIEAWVYPDGSSSSQTIIIVTKYNSNVSQMTFHFYVGVGGQLVGGIYNNFSGWIIPYTPTGVVQYDTWSHLAYTVDLSTQTHTLYINGVAMPEDPASPSISGTLPTAFNNTTIPVEIGSSTNSSGSKSYAVEQIDEVRIWNVARTQTQIRDNMTKKLTGNEAGLVGYWRMDEGTGTTVFDSSPNGNNGTLQ